MSVESDLKQFAIDNARTQAEGLDVPTIGHDVDFLQRLLWYEYNAAPGKQFEDVYGGGQDQFYMDEKIELMKDNWLGWVGSLDDYHRDMLVRAIYRKYPVVK